jgi:hypothetical protein
MMCYVLPAWRAAYEAGLRWIVSRTIATQRPSMVSLSSSGHLVAGQVGFEIELSAEAEDSSAAVGESAEAEGVGLE